MSATHMAQRFVEELEAYRSPEKREKYQRHFKTGEGEYGEGDVFIGVRMGQVFALAKEFVDMPPQEIEQLLESPVHEARAGALSIVDKQLSATCSAGDCVSVLVAMLIVSLSVRRGRLRGLRRPGSI